MSMKRMVVLTAVSTSNQQRNSTSVPQTQNYDRHGRNNSNFDSGINMTDSVNVVLAGAILSVLTAMVCVMCYCCNKSINKRSMAIYRQRWLESLNDPNMGIYSVEQFYDSTASHATTNVTYHQGEPPSYDTVMESEKKYAEDKKCLVTSRVSMVQTCKHCGSITTDDTLCSTVKDQNEAGTTELIDVDKTKQTMEVNNGTRKLCINCDNSDRSNTADVPDNNGNVCKTCTCTPINAEVNGNIIVADNQSDTTAAYNTNSTDDNALHANQTVASTSAPKFNAQCCENCAKRLQNQQANNEETNSDDFDHLNGNGIVRMDMSKIIDATGLPTYDAALKLESCGYV